MKYKLIVLFLVACNVAKGNIISNVLEKIKAGSNNNGPPVVHKVSIPNTNMFYYKLGNKPASNQIHITVEPKPVDKSDYDMTAVQEALRWQQTVDAEPVKEVVVSKNPPSEEQGQKIAETEIDILYGKTSPIRDDAVAAAWEEANAAQRRLEEHREYMEKVRLARLAKSQAKKNDTQANSN